MKQLLLFLFFPMAIFGQTSNTGRSISGPSANRPVCSREVSDSNAHNGDVYSDTDDGNAYKCLGGAWGIFGGRTISAVHSPNLFVFNTHESDVGSNAYVDIRAHGAYERLSSTTCSTKSGSPHVMLGVASNFKNGEYATCYNAGAATTAASQSAPTVTPSVHAGGMTATMYTGSASYAYEIVGEDPYNGRTAASSAGSTSTAAATLGKVGNTFTRCTRSNQTVTCTTGSSHSFIPGMQIWVAGMTDTTFNGNWVTISPTSGTTVTWNSGWDARNGASTSTTQSSTTLSYNVWGWFMNRVSWSHDAASFRHHIYGPNCPTICNWIGQTVLDYWDDYGATMRSNQTQPPYIPTMAPSASANKHFTFRISSGGGTTTLTASSSAGASVSGNGIVSDVGPAIIAAADAAVAKPSGKTSSIFIPNTGIAWVVNSYTNLYNKSAPIILNGSTLVPNQPIDNAAAIIGTGNGGVSQFGWSPGPTVGAGIGYPILANTGASATRPVLKNVSIYPNQSNGGLAIYLNTPVDIDWDTVFIGSSADSRTDCIGQGVVIQSFSTGFYWNINKFTFGNGYCGVGGTEYSGDSPVPFFTSTGPSSGGPGSGGGIYLKQGWFIARGGVNLDFPSHSCTGSITATLERIWNQNNTVPAFSVSGPCSSGLATEVRLTDLYAADFATPSFVNYGYMRGPVIAENWAANSSFSGNPIPAMQFRNVGTYGAAGPAGTNSQSSNQIVANIWDSYYGSGYTTQGITQMNEHFILGAGFSLFTNTNQPAAPSCSVASGTPASAPAGSYYLFYAPVYQNGGIGIISPASSSICTTNGASQQITGTIPSAVSGALSYVWYYGTTTSGGYSFSCYPGSSSLTYTWAGAACNQPGSVLPGGGPAGITNGNVYATDFVLGPTIAPTGVTNSTKFYMDGKTLWPSFKPNGNRAYVIPGISGSITNGHNLCASGTSGAYVDCLTTQTVAKGAVTLETTAIAARTCATVVTAAATGVTTTDTVSYSFNAAPSDAYNAGLFIQSYVTEGNVNFLVCNSTTESLTPPAATLNWRVIR